MAGAGVVVWSKKESRYLPDTLLAWSTSRGKTAPKRGPAGVARFRLSLLPSSRAQKGFPQAGEPGKDPARVPNVGIHLLREVGTWGWPRGWGGGCTQAGESRARGGDVLPARRARGVFVGVVKTRMTKLTLAERSLCSHDVPYMISFNYYSQLDPKSVEDLGSSEAYSSMQ